MTTDAPVDYARERLLIEKLQLRIGSAATSEKLQDILDKFLSALIDKLTTRDTQNRDLTIQVCQYINSRLKIDQGIQLPVEKLSTIFEKYDNAFVKQFSLLFLRQGLNRLPPQAAISNLPVVLRSSIRLTLDSQNDRQVFVVAIDFLLATLVHWKLPEQRSDADNYLKDHFNLTQEQTTVIARQLSHFLLHDPKTGISPLVLGDLEPVFNKHFLARSNIVPNIADFIFTSIFTDEQRFIPATILSVDANATAASRADVMFKQCTFDLNSDTLVDAAFDLYWSAKPRLRTRILRLLSRSSTSTSRTDKIVSIVESQLSTSASNLEIGKLRAEIFSYLVYAIQVNPDIGLIAERLQASLKEFIETQGWPVASGLSYAETELRAKAYESIGLLSKSISRLTRSDVDRMQMHDSSPAFNTISWLFTSLRCDTSRDVRHSIEAALGSLMTSTVVENTEELTKYKSLLLWNVVSKEGDQDPIYGMPTHTTAQYQAVRFANRILPLSDVDARIMNLMALSSGRREVIEEGNNGLRPKWHASNFSLDSLQANSSPVLPLFNQFAKRVFEDGASSPAESTLLRSAPALGALVQFSQTLIAAQAWHGSRFDLVDEADWNNKTDTLLANDADARSLFRTRLNTESNSLIVELIQACYEGMVRGSEECGHVGLQLTSLVSNTVLHQLSRTALQNLESVVQTVRGRDTASRIIGIMLSSDATWAQVADADLCACEEWQTTGVDGQDVDTIGSRLLKSGYLISRAALRGAVTETDEIVEKLWTVCKNIVTKTNGKGKRYAYISVGQLGLCLPKMTKLPYEYEVMLDGLFTDAKKENETALLSLGRLLFPLWPLLSPEKQENVLQKLYDLHEIRKAEFHFALGEALAVAALGFSSSSTLTEFDVDAHPPTSKADHSLFTHMLNDILEKVKTTKPALKKSAGIWLLSLVQFCTIGDLVKPRLRECQAAFSRLLTDRDDVVQETGSRGLGIVYEQGDKTLREELIRDLVQSFTGNNAKAVGTVTEDTQLFEPGALPTENGQSVTTYKDIVSLAQEMGDPSLVYRFMNLASNNAIWTSRAAFGRFGLSGILADSTYLQENRKLYPKLFRYRFDPNPNVQRSMNDIWKALVKDPNAVIDQHFDLIMEDLLQSVVSGKEWRAREASCAAISDLVQGQEVEKFEKHLNEIWKVAFKVLDDVKESVRVAAMGLCRTLTNMVIRNLGVGEGTTKRATTMLKHAIPFLLQQMDAGAAKEVQQYSIVTLLSIVKKAPPRSLQQDAPVILENLINSLSSLEHENINYLHLNAEKYGLTTEQLDNMRVSSVGRSPVSDAIEKCIDSLTVGPTDSENAVDEHNTSVTPMRDAMKRLESSFKTAIGLPSKVGLSRAMITLVVRHHSSFRPYADRFLRLTRKNVIDRNATISQSFSTAAAYLIRLASEKEIRQTIAHAEKLYFDSQDDSHRAVAGEIVHAISKASNDVFMNFASSFLPFSFIGRNDLDEDTREKFDSSWKDNVGGSRALHLYLKEIVELTQRHIKSSLQKIRHACCFAVADLVSSLDAEQELGIDAALLLWPLLEEALSGKTWPGKERVVQALPKFVKKARIIWPEKTQQMKTIAIREAKRTNVSYQQHAIRALAEFSKIRQDLDMGAEVVPSLVEVVEKMVVDTDAMDVDDTPSHSGYSSEKLVDESLCSAITCLFSILRKSSTFDVLEQSIVAVKRTHAQNSSVVRLTLYREMERFLDDVVNYDQKKDASEVGMSSSGTIPDFLHELTLALFGAEELSQALVDAESLRLAAIQLATKISRSQISHTTRNSLDKVFGYWLEHERSRPLRLLIKEASEKNKMLTTNQ